ncbi:MAG: cytochrome c3 family protein [Desulfovibrionaceae bacterium]
MKKFVLLLAALAALTCLSALPALAATDAPKQAIEMKFPADSNKYGPIMFEHHAQHLALKAGCVACHHKWDGKAEITGCRVEGCHTDISKDKKREPTSYDSAFHSKNSLNSCIGCHTALLKDNPASKAPKKCNDCHTKK